MYIPEGNHEKLGYRPTNFAYRIVSDPQFRYDYDETLRESELIRLKETFPDLTLVIESINAMGLLPCCSEILIWVDFRNKILEDRPRRNDSYCMTRIIKSIASRKDAQRQLQSLYFEYVLPVAAAMDMGYGHAAYDIYVAASDRIINKYSLAD